MFAEGGENPLSLFETNVFCEMSDLIWVALIQGVSGFGLAIYARRTARAALETLEVSKRTEQNTNHIHDELVAVTKTASHAEGVIEGRAVAKAEAEAKADEK
jgi:hypothetical protein